MLSLDMKSLLKIVANAKNRGNRLCVLQPSFVGGNNFISIATKLFKNCNDNIFVAVENIYCNDKTVVVILLVYCHENIEIDAMIILVLQQMPTSCNKC